ncbi:hypothetical protein Maq22A_c06795 [Methylobacterium aquaticum]|uniref:Uncharacterized protein n=1 Tax=Methylobacterium aquaticum TaxID=270351 RepID=A0A0C6FCX5_9HYPH|nr:hypothetical protein Maq22A_c06795 [Methylobacterium aquaticum]
MRAPRPPALPLPTRGPHGPLQLPRGLLQPGAATLRPGLPLTPRLRTGAPPKTRNRDPAQPSPVAVHRNGAIPIPIPIPIPVIGHAAGLELHEVGPLRPFLGGLELLPRVQLQPLQLVRGEDTGQDLGLNLGIGRECRGDRQRAKGCLALPCSFVPRLFVQADLPVHGAGMKGRSAFGTMRRK